MINQLPLRSDVASKLPTLVYQALLAPAIRSDWSARATQR
jgi:hypothetical protein